MGWQDPEDGRSSPQRRRRDDLKAKSEPSPRLKRPRVEVLESIAAHEAWLAPCGWCGRPSGLRVQGRTGPSVHEGCRGPLARAAAERASQGVSRDAAST